MAQYNAEAYAGDRARVYNQDDEYRPRQNAGYGPPRPTRPPIRTYQTTPPTPTSPTPSPYSPAWTATIPTQQASSGPQVGGQPYLGQTVTPTTQVGLSPEERQRIYNQARINFTGAMRQGTQEMSGLMGGRGFVPGQSGIADAAIGKVYGQGLRDLGGVMQGIATDEARNRFAQGLELDKLNIGQSQWAQQFGAQREDQAAQDLMNLLQFYQGNQAAVYAPYWNTMGGSILGQG